MYLRLFTAGEQTEAATILDLLISLALLTAPVDLEALNYIKLMCAFFEVSCWLPISLPLLTLKE